jgi:hypothetical protein
VFAAACVQAASLARLDELLAQAEVPECSFVRLEPEALSNL